MKSKPHRAMPYINKKLNPEMALIAHVTFAKANNCLPYFNLLNLTLFHVN